MVARPPFIPFVVLGCGMANLMKSRFQYILLFTSKLYDFCYSKYASVLCLSNFLSDVLCGYVYGASMLGLVLNFFFFE